MFADDTNLTTNGKRVEDIQEHLNTDLEKVHRWLLANKLTLHKEKTEYMIIGSRQRLVESNTDLTITMGGANIERVKHTKTSGIVVDEYLSWKNQISNIIAKVTKGIVMLRRMKVFVLRSTLITIYNLLILPHFDYCSFVWDNCSKYLLDKLQKMQNRAARVITGRPYDINSSTVLRELDWQPLANRTEQNKAEFMCIIRNKELSECMANLFNVTNNTNYNLRSNRVDFALPKPNTNFMKKSISYSDAKLWNNLPKNVKEKQISVQLHRTILNGNIYACH